MKKKFNLLIVLILLISLTGCTKYLKNEEASTSIGDQFKEVLEK